MHQALSDKQWASTGNRTRPLFQVPPTYLDQPNPEMLYEPLKAHSPVPYIFTFHEPWTVILVMEPETAQTVLFPAAAFSVVTERMALGYMTQFFSLNSRDQTCCNHYFLLLESMDIWMEGPSTSGEPKDLTGVTARKQSLSLLFPSPSLVTPVVWRRDLSKGIFSNFLQKFNFSIPIPFTRLVKISWHHPARDIPAWDKDPRGRWALCTQLGATTCKCPTMFYHTCAATSSLTYYQEI